MSTKLSTNVAVDMTTEITNLPLRFRISAFDRPNLALGQRIKLSFAGLTLRAQLLASDAVVRHDELWGKVRRSLQGDRGDVPGWVLVVLMTTGLITGIWTVAAPRLSAILTHSLDSMNNIR